MSETLANPKHLQWERVTIFEESILRHGTYFLWSYRCDRAGEMNEMSRRMLGAGLVELTDWESGRPGMLPGLRMTLIEHCRQSYMDEDDEEGRTSLTLRLLQLVSDLVIGPPKEKKDADDAKSVESFDSTATGDSTDSTETTHSTETADTIQSTDLAEMNEHLVISDDTKSVVDDDTEGAETA